MKHLQWGNEILEPLPGGVYVKYYCIGSKAELTVIKRHTRAYRAMLIHDDIAADIETRDYYDTPQEAVDALRKAVEELL